MITLPTKQEIMETRGALLTPEQKELIRRRNAEIVNLRKQGMSLGELGRRYDLSSQRIKTICHMAGVYGIIRKK